MAEHAPYCEQTLLSLMAEDRKSALGSEHLAGLLEHTVNICHTILRKDMPYLNGDQRDDMVAQYIYEVYKDKIMTGLILEQFNPEKNSRLASYLAGLITKKSRTILRKSRGRHEVELNEDQLVTESPQDLTVFADWETLDQMTFTPRLGVPFTSDLKCLGGQLGEKLDWQSEPTFHASFTSSLKISQSRLEEILLSQRLDWAGKLFEAWRLTYHNHDLWMKSLKKGEEESEEDTESRDYHRLMQGHSDRFNRDLPRAILHPLSTANIVELFGVTRSNADQMKSRSRKSFQDLVEPGGQGTSLETVSGELRRLIWGYQVELESKD